MIYTFIGQPMSGKTTLAKMLHKKMLGSLHLDGDDLRTLFRIPYSKEHLSREWREEQTRTLQRFVAHIADQDIPVIVSTVNPYKNIREEFKQSRKDIREIYVWKTDSRERESFKVLDYEPPTENFIDIMTTDRTPQESLDEILEKLMKYRN